MATTDDAKTASIIGPPKRPLLELGYYPHPSDPETIRGRARDGLMIDATPRPHGRYVYAKAIGQGRDQDDSGSKRSRIVNLIEPHGTEWGGADESFSAFPRAAPSTEMPESSGMGPQVHIRLVRSA